MEARPDKSIRRKPREFNTYPSIEAAELAKLEIARKQLTGRGMKFLKEKK